MKTEGLLKKYAIIKADGRPTDPKAEYFVLRLDYHDGTDIDRAHVVACRTAARAYAAAIAPWLPDLATELCQKFPLPASLKGMPVSPDAHDGHR